jgi:hypothetical protein
VDLVESARLLQYKHLVDMSTETVAKPQRVNLRRPDIMEAVREQVEQHYGIKSSRSSVGAAASSKRGLKVPAGKEFGFGVERAIDLAMRRVKCSRPANLQSRREHSQPRGQRATHRDGREVFDRRDEERRHR